MSRLPLIAHRSLDDILAWRAGEAISVRRFLGDVQGLAAQLPPGQHVLNLCRDRYRFAVALAACIVSRRISVLPAAHTPETARQLRRTAPDLFCIVDHDAVVVELPSLRYPETIPPVAGDPVWPRIDGDQIVAQVYTSGSTGEPLPHRKRWGSLVKNVRTEAQRLGVGRGFAILGTVPAQHMYGLESTVLMPLQCGAALHAGHPFYPADICAALNALPRPRMLVTTPFHLRTLLAEQTDVPALDLLVSATAPLSRLLAQDAEARFGAPLHEIYGCTETGQLASRRTVAEECWRTLGDVRLRRAGDAVWAEGGHIDLPARLGDIIEFDAGSAAEAGTGARIFRLLGRHADLVNIAGKRSSLAYLTHQLNAIDGVVDGVFLAPADTDDAAIGRLSALVVAPGLTPETLMQALRERIDPVFLPRPLRFVEALPRNALGKLPKQPTQALPGRPACGATT